MKQGQQGDGIGIVAYRFGIDGCKIRCQIRGSWVGGAR